MNLSKIALAAAVTPAELIEGASRVYIEAFETITGRTFQPPAATGESILERIRRNLAPYRL